MKIKICGLRTCESVQAATVAGTDLIGLVFYPPSPRYLQPSEADHLVAFVKTLPQPPRLVGLFVNTSLNDIQQAVEQYNLDYVQLSGDETLHEVKQIALPVIKTLRLPHNIEPSEALKRAALFGELPNVTLLIDTHQIGSYGGTGTKGNWEIARQIARHYPTLLAGGLTPDNVGEAIEAVLPWGVDVSSGVESKPGLKDAAKITKFCSTVQQSRKNYDPSFL